MQPHKANRALHVLHRGRILELRRKAVIDREPREVSIGQRIEQGLHVSLLVAFGKPAAMHQDRRREGPVSFRHVRVKCQSDVADFGIRHVRDRSGACLRLRQRLARQHLLAHRRMIDERRHDGRGLHEVCLLQPIVHIHIGVMRAGLIFHRVLNELETGQSHGVEGKMIGAGGIANGQGRRPHVVERCQPGVEDGARHIIALQEDAADFAAAVIQVEVTGDLGVSGLQRHGFTIGEMLLNICF